MENITEHRMLFSQRLSLLIKYNGLTSAELARAINVSAPLITKYTSGQASPSYENFIRIADYFNVSMDYLRGKSNSFNGDSIKSSKVDYWVELFESLQLNEVQQEELLNILKGLNNKMS
ncbi:helix-turn-helix domain-containing protein [Cytobacillus horneckiae]|uniref:helix-turn-helix domain-containing protein n=1 Tax=Cytobacillus horneckiae TaxID=549687 RepID=UPI003D1AEB81